MSFQKIKLLALDLDGTTLKSDTTLSPKVESALKTAVENNIIVVAASGRPYGSMPDHVLDIDGVDYAITSNGSAVYDKHGKRIHSQLISEDDVLKFLEATQNYDLIFEAFIKGDTFSDSRYVNNPIKYGCPPAYFDYVQSSRGHVDNMREFIYEHRNQLDSIEYVCTDKVLRDLAKADIVKSTDGFFITSSSENFVEFSAKSATKANATEYVCKLLGIDRQNTSACGNADNDVDMIRWAGLGAAVKNASSLCLECADLVVASNNDDGVAELVQHILRLNG